MAMDRHYGAGFGIPGPSKHNAAATLPPGVGPRGLSFSAAGGVYGEATPAAARQYSYPGNVPFHSNTLPANFPGFDETGPHMFPGFNPNLDSFEEEMLADWTEDQKKEREVILGNRVKLTQYIHDVTVLFPNMKQDGVFTKDDCHLVNHEITGTMKVDKFIDILLTKGPKAIGNFHSALETEYPALFEVLSRLFVNAGVSLPPERQLREDSEEDSGNASTSSSGHSDGVPPRGRSVYRCGIKTIRKHFFELQRHCDEVQNQKDELQKSLIQREKEINSLLSHRDQVLNQKYEEFIRLMANWRELITIQSDDRLQKMQQLLSEREDIQSEYEQLEQEYMLVVSELNAARDRISKLLNHLERTSKEAGLTQEQLLDKISQLEAEIAQKEGIIQRMNRQMNRVGKDVKSSATVEAEASDDSSSELAILQERLKTVQEERDSFEQRMKVALKERQGTLDENERLVSKCHSEKERRRKAEKSLQRLLSPQYPGDTNSTYSGMEGATNEVEPLDEVTVVMPAEDMGLTLDTTVVVKELTDSGNATKSGVKLGDQLLQVNRIKISSDKDDPLGFAMKLLDSASQTVTLSLLRPSAAMPQGSYGGFPLTPGLANTPISPLPGTLSMSINPLEYEMERRYRKVSAGAIADGNQPLSLPISRPPYYKYISAGKASRSTSASAVDTSDKDSDDSLSLVSGDARNDSDLIDHRVSLASSHDFGAGIVTSPRASRAEHYPVYQSEDFEHEDINILTGNGDIPTTGILTASTSESKLLTSSLISDHVMDGEMNQSSPLHRRKLVKKEKRKRVVSRSLENIYKVEGSSEVILRALVPRGGDKSGARQVLLPSGQFGTGLHIMGGRGNGYFIQSDRPTNRSLQSGDEILAIGDWELGKMNYAEVRELLASFKEKGKCIIQVKSNLQGYTRLLANESSTRDNFYIRSKMSYQRPVRGGNQLLSYEKGDIFHVFDTLPRDQVGVWHVKKLNSRGEAIETGFIPVEVSPSETGEGASTLPPWIAKNFSPKTKPKSPHSLPPLLDKQKSIPAAIHAYKFYEPIKIVKMTEPRPVVLLGAHEAEIRRYLVEHGSNSDIKFAYCKKEPTENLADVPEDQIVETIETSDGPVASTVEHVHEIAKDGFHCVLCLHAEDLTRPGVASLTPIVLLLNPKRGFKIKLHSAPGHIHVGQMGNNQPATFQPEQIRELGRKYKLYITGELELSSTMHVMDITHEVRDKVASQQKSIIWEIDS